VDRHRFEADPNPSFHFDADPDPAPDPDATPSYVGKSDFLLLFITVSVYIVSSFSSVS
jgi:hypothetical protein